MANNIKEFRCRPVVLVYNSETFKKYGADYDEKKYPNLKKNKYKNLSLIGNIHELGLGQEYIVKAEEQNDSKFGYQYKIISIRMDRPNNEVTTRMFLSEILTPDQVDTIMKSYPDIVDRVMKNNLDDIDLSKLYNIGTYRFGVIKRKIEENFMFAELIDMFNGMINFSTVKKLYDEYPSINKIKQILQSNPYKCLCNLSGIGFKTADKIILDLDQQTKKERKKGIPTKIYFDFNVKHSLQRATASIEFLLEKNEKDGHTKMFTSELRKEFDILTPECSDKFAEVIKNEEIFYIDKADKSISFLTTYLTELYIAHCIKQGLNEDNVWDNISIEQFRKVGDNELTDEQFNALQMFYNNNISILNGFGGSGKSFTTEAILNLVKSLKKSFYLLCPTGRASKVLAAYAKEDAQTIHRGLLYNPSDGWGYNKENKLPYDVVMVDEMSMTDIFLMEKLLDAIDFKKTKLLFIGDSFQIPSVGSGNVLHDMINSNIIPVTSLTKIFRYGVGGVLTVATKTRLGEKWIEDEKGSNIFGEDKGYIYMPMPQEKILPTVKTLYTKLMNSGIKPEDILVLSSYNVGDYGTIRINNEIQKIANKNYGTNEYFKSGNTLYYVDDMVIQTKNDYKSTIYDENLSVYDYDDNAPVEFISNGDIGRVIIVDKDYMVVQYDEARIIYDKETALTLLLSYSISTHKSQGGSCENIILITPKAHTFMLNANLIYVGQTRAIKRCYHLGEPRTINSAIKKRANLNRKTYLKDLLSAN